MNSLIAFPHYSSTLVHRLRLKQPLSLSHNFLLKLNSSPSLVACCSSAPSPNPSNSDQTLHSQLTTPQTPSFLSPIPKLSCSDRAFFLLAFIASTTSVAFTTFVFAAVPTLFAMRNAAISLSKLADTAREELPSTMAAIRLSGMEISDLTLELSDLSQEIADGVNKSAQALHAAEAGIRQIGSMAQQQTVSMIQERASLPIISLQPAVAGAARKTSRAVGRATKSLFKIISGRQDTAEYDDDDGTYM
ncbi:hypothetical protein Fmac_022684 [Flemingia macrophylla]|uniref:Transmembrane protein n=1 Tax=Flemingia macrophylla TaxID=520843 RepID=A0ABD1M0E4_9FABA